jgi:hypothetical protein
MGVLKVCLPQTDDKTKTVDNKLKLSRLYSRLLLTTVQGHELLRPQV